MADKAGGTKDKPKAEAAVVKKSTKNKRTQTVRERSQTSDRSKKPRRIKRTASAAARPFRAVGRGTKKAVRPLKPIARPFKSRPSRFVGRTLLTILLLRYFRQAWKELRQVEWPNRRETWKLTLAVLMFAIAFGVVIAVVDFGLDKLFKKILLS